MIKSAIEGLLRYKSRIPSLPLAVSFAVPWVQETVGVWGEMTGGRLGSLIRRGKASTLISQLKNSSPRVPYGGSSSPALPPPPRFGGSGSHREGFLARFASFYGFKSMPKVRSALPWCLLLLVESSWLWRTVSIVPVNCVKRWFLGFSCSLRILGLLRT